MTFVITETCIDTTDQACVSVCPVDCIHFEEGTDRMLYINPVECIDCGACQPACPVSAIFPEGDVPADQARFIEINSLWYEDADAARARVGGGGGAPAAPAVTEAAPAAAASAETAPATTGETAPATPAEPAPAAPAVAAVAAPAAPAPAVMQVPATAGVSTSGVSAYNLPSPVGVGLLALIGLAIYVMFVFPGPTWSTLDWADGIFRAIRIDNGGQVGATVLVLAPLVPVLVIVFIAMQWKAFALFAASHPRRTNKWRSRSSDWRPNEESRRYNLVETVQAIARDRFSFPDQANPDLQTYVNLPEPTMGVEVRGSGDKMFPDIVTLSNPGFYPVAIAQVESKETVTEEQATYVWAALENKDCPLYIYVPAGMLRRSQDLATAAGMKNVRFRTWRWSPNGMVVKEA